MVRTCGEDRRAFAVQALADIFGGNKTVMLGSIPGCGGRARPATGTASSAPRRFVELCAIVDQARSSSWNQATDISGRDARGLAAERRDDDVVDVVPSRAPSPTAEQECLLLRFCGRAWQVLQSQSLPGLDGWAQKQVDRFGEGGPGLVSREIKQTTRRHQMAAAVAKLRGWMILPDDAADEPAISSLR